MYFSLFYIRRTVVNTTILSQAVASTTPTAKKGFIANTMEPPVTNAECSTQSNGAALSLPKKKKRGGAMQRKTRGNVISLFGGDGSEIAQLLKDVKPISADRWQGGNEEHSPSSTPRKLAELQISSTMSCTTCGIIFDTRDEQMEHFKGDWHRFNIKQRLKGANSVTEMSFTEMADNISSLSGTDFTESDADDKSDNVVEEIRRKLPHLPVLEEDDESSSDEESQEVMMASRHSQLFMLTPSGQVLSIYRPVLFHKKEHPQDLADILYRVEQAPSHNLWIVIMMGGGHFASAVFENENAVVHKTFHRYVVRAKCGTSQSQHDKKGGHAMSAGAQIRRHNESALAQDIEDLLVSWKGYIDKCHRIFIRVGTHNYPYIFNKKNKVSLDKQDKRIRMIPFPTKRATFSEVKRVHAELSSIRILDADQKPSALEKTKKKLTSKRGPSLERRRRQGDPVDELDDEIDGAGVEADIELRYQDDIVDTVSTLEDHGHFIPSRTEILEEECLEKRRKSRRSKKSNVKVTPAKPKPETLLPFQSEFYTACTVGDRDQLERLVEEHTVEITQCADNFSSAISLPLNSQGHTLLHIACQHAHSQLIQYLLGIGCDPSKEDEKSIVPYLSTQNKAVRNEFRIFMGSFPDKFDYVKAHVPGPLTKEMAAEKDEKESERRKQINKKKKERLKIKKAETAIQRAEEEERNRFLALSDREKRALAAEKRLMQTAATTTSTPLVLNRCYHCAKDITGKIPFEYSNNTFCSPSCLKTHRLSQKTAS